MTFVHAALLLLLFSAHCGTTIQTASAFHIAITTTTPDVVVGARGRRIASTTIISAAARHDEYDVDVFGRDGDDDRDGASRMGAGGASSSTATTAAFSSSSSIANAAKLASVLLLLSSPLVVLPPEAACAYAAVPSSSSSSSLLVLTTTTTTKTTRTIIPTDTATSIDIDLKSLPSLTRRAIANRERLTSYVLDGIKSLEPILEILSEGDAPVKVSPPRDVKGAIDMALTKGDATFVINGNQVVDVRLESVPGALIIRVINPNIPKLPLLGDGTAAMRFVDDVVIDATPENIDRAVNGARAVGDFLTWGAPRGPPLRYGGSPLDVYLSSKFEYYGGDDVDVTNADVIFGSLAIGIGGSYASSYAYYVKSREEDERDANEKRAKVAAAAAAKAAAAEKKKAKAKEEAKVKEEVENVAFKAEGADADVGGGGDSTKAKEVGGSVVATTTTVEATEKADEGDGIEVGVGESTIGDDASRGGGGDVAPRRRKRDAFMKNVFGRGKN